MVDRDSHQRIEARPGALYTPAPGAVFQATVTHQLAKMCIPVRRVQIADQDNGTSDVPDNSCGAGSRIFTF